MDNSNKSEALSTFEGKFLPSPTTHSLTVIMDALGAAVNVASLVDLSAKGVNVLFRYVHEVTMADTNLRRAKERLKQEEKVLENFKELGGHLQSFHSKSEDEEQLREKLLEDMYHEMQLEDFHKELGSFIRWLDHQGGKGALCEGHPDRDEMSLPQRLKWPLYGKRKVRKFAPKLAERRVHMILTLLVILRLLFIPSRFLIIKH